MRWWLVLTVGAGLAAFAGPAGVNAQTPPTRAFGTVTVDGSPAPAGTAVQAFINGKLCGEGVVRRVSDGLPLGYVVDVIGAAQTEGCGTDGDTISFTVGGVKANETGTFATGTFLRLDLSVSGQVATPTAGPTPPPFGATASPPAGAGASPTGTASSASGTAGASPTGSPGAAETAAASTTATSSPTASPASIATFVPAAPAPTARGGSGSNTAAIVAVIALLAAAATGVGGYVWYRQRQLP